MAENNAPAGEQPKKGKLKMIILLVVIIILAIALSVVGTLWFLGGDIPGTSGGDEASETQEPTFVASQYLELEKSLTTTVPATDRQRYAQISVALESKDPQVLAAAELHMPLLRSRLITAIGSSQFDQLRTPGGRRALADTMLASVNEALEQEGEAPLEAVLFRNFVLQ